MRLRRSAGRPRLTLQAHEVRLMLSLLADLSTLFDDDTLATDDPVHQRLFPSAYRDDDEAAAEYRSMTESGLRTDRLDRIGACVADLATSGDGPCDIDLAPPDVATRWIQVLNDLRLALGTRLGVSEDSEPDLDPADPESQPWFVYFWLTSLQDTVVTGLVP